MSCPRYTPLTNVQKNSLNVIVEMCVDLTSKLLAVRSILMFCVDGKDPHQVAAGRNHGAILTDDGKVSSGGCSFAKLRCLVFIHL